jgi:tetratricopeptide (TPR) repeat protein
MTWLLILFFAQADLAKEAMTKGNYAQAAKLYAQLAAAYPNEPLIRFNQALAQYSAQQYAAAIPTFQRFLKSQPTHPQANLLLASSLVKTQKPCEALAPLQQATPLQSAAEYWSVAAQAQFDCLDYAAAVQAYEAWTRLAPTNPRAWYGLGRARLEVQDKTGAAEAFARLSSLPYSSELRQIEIDVARGLAKQKRIPEARQAYERLLSNNPRDAEAEYELGALADSPEAALEHYRRAVECQPNFPIAQAALGRALLATGQGPAAIPHLEAAAKTLNDKSVWTALANAYRSANRPADAQRALAKAQRPSAKSN